jgi:LysM repeat protein
MTEPREPLLSSDAAPLDACPNLASVDGPWHAARPSRAHRCRLLAEGRPTLERQAEHCLVADHVLCPTWLEAAGSATHTGRPGPFVTTAPVVLEGPGVGMPSDRVARRLAAPATVVVAGVAIGAFLLARGPLTPGTSSAGNEAPSPTPAATATPTATAPSATASPVATAQPSAPPTPTPVPVATPRPTTYKVRSGDSLSGIAAKFGISAAALAKLNKITNPSLIRVGQVLTLP